MTVDVVVPCRNRSALVRETLGSIARQGVPDITVVVVDDFSEPVVSSDEVSDCGVEVTLLRNQQQLGIAGSRNRGAKLGRSPFVAFVDSDDLWVEGALSSLITSAKATGADLVFGQVEHFLDQALSLNVHQGVPAPALVPMSGSCLFRRDSFDALGGFSESLPMGEFVDLISRAREANWVITPINRPVLRRRIHEGNYSRLSRQASDGYLEVVRRHMARRSEQA
jgi:glycosyltransferase involved in cell wall biosynthesis